MIACLTEELYNAEGVPGRSQELVGAVESKRAFPKPSPKQDRVDGDTACGSPCRESWSKGEACVHDLTKGLHECITGGVEKACGRNARPPSSDGKS